MTELELVQKAIDDKIGKDIVTLKLDSAVADYFVIATANAPNHAQSI
ncbi:MAG: RsfS/YbeB/iojap family protein, partial [Finegoldia magna]|nr:RsfS/YbeB/iojap family protein [Finegoldia magna]